MRRRSPFAKLVRSAQWVPRSERRPYSSPCCVRDVRSATPEVCRQPARCSHRRRFCLSLADAHWSSERGRTDRRTATRARLWFEPSLPLEHRPGGLLCVSAIFRCHRERYKSSGPEAMRSGPHLHLAPLMHVSRAVYDRGQSGKRVRDRRATRYCLPRGPSRTGDRARQSRRRDRTSLELKP